MGFFKTAPMRYLLLVTGAWLVIFLLTRSVLLITHLDEVGGNLLPVFGVGLLYDLGFLAYAALPLGLYLLLCPPALWRRRGHRWFLQAVLTVSLFAMLFTSVAEWLFWDEFGVRFNFIAVDYLVYSDEVLNNLLESYPIGKLLSLLAMLAIVLSLALRKPFNAAMSAPLPTMRGRLAECPGPVGRRRPEPATDQPGQPTRPGRQRLQERTGEQWPVSVLCRLP